VASQRFKTIFESNLKQFVGYFSHDAKSLFINEKNKLIHPGEYGRYREDSCKQILQTILNKNVAISDGFVITSNDEITTQCDIIIYNALASPIISDGIARMFPAEEVRLVGEIKSVLDRQGYIEALRKLAINKERILKGRTGNGIRNMDSKTYDTIGTFLICSKLKFDYKSLDYEEIYNGIERKYWHNSVLSIEDGCFEYALDFKRASANTQSILKRNGYIIENIANVLYPLYYFGDDEILTYKNHIEVDKEDKYHHIIQFFVGIASCSNDVWTYLYDPVEYLGLNGKFFFDENENNDSVANDEEV